MKVLNSMDQNEANLLTGILFCYVSTVENHEKVIRETSLLFTFRLNIHTRDVTIGNQIGSD